MAVRCLTIIMTITGRILLFLGWVVGEGKVLVYRRFVGLGLDGFLTIISALLGALKAWLKSRLPSRPMRRPKSEDDMATP